MSCEFDCIYKNLAVQTQSEIREIIDENEEWTQRQDEYAKNGWGDYASRRIQEGRHRDVREIEEMLEVEGLLCDEMVCGFAAESVRKRLEAMNFDVRNRREQL